MTENPLKAEVRSEDGQQRINVVVSQAAALKRTLFQVGPCVVSARPSRLPSRVPRTFLMPAGRRSQARMRSSSSRLHISVDPSGTTRSVPTLAPLPAAARCGTAGLLALA